MSFPKVLEPLALQLHEWDVVLAFELSSLPFADRDHKAVAIADNDGNVIGCSAPRQVANAEAVSRACLEAFPSWDDGTVVVTSDPFSGTAHVQDHWVARPVYDGATRTGLALVAVHLADVGGQSFGNFFPAARDVFQEGVRTTPLRLARNGAIDRDALEMVKLNSRAPVLVEHDLMVMHRLAETMADEASSLLANGGEEILKTEASLLDSVIQHIEGEAAPQTGTVHNCAGPDANVSLVVRRDDGGLVVDFSGSSPQAESGFINSTLTHTRSAVTAALADLTPAVANSGLLRSVVIDAPEASIVNCDYPLATAWSPYHPARLINTMIKESLDGRLPSGVGKAPPEVRMPTVRIDGCREGSCPF